jgi:hypothetical protein
VSTALKRAWLLTPVYRAMALLDAMHPAAGEPENAFAYYVTMRDALAGTSDSRWQRIAAIGRYLGVAGWVEVPDYSDLPVFRSADGLTVSLDELVAVSMHGISRVALGVRKDDGRHLVLCVKRRWWLKFAAPIYETGRAA